MEYVETVIQTVSFSPNDNYKNDTAVTLAAYHGFTRVLQLLLSVESCPITNPNGLLHTHGADAMEAAVRNGQHHALQVLFQERPEECKRLLRSPKKKILGKVLVITLKLAQIIINYPKRMSIILGV